MVNQTNIWNFLNYNYTPFSKKQCIKRLLSLWAFSFIPSFIGAQSAKWMLITIFPNIMVSILFLLLIIRYSQLRISRYVCDGFTYLYIAIILMLSAYRIITLGKGNSSILLAMLASVLVIDILLFAFITLHNVSIDKFNPNHCKDHKAALPFIFGLGGFLIASFFLRGKSEEVGITVLATCLMVLSLIIGIGSLNFLKAFLLIKTEKSPR